MEVVLNHSGARDARAVERWFWQKTVALKSAREAQRNVQQEQGRRPPPLRRKKRQPDGDGKSCVSDLRRKDARLSRRPASRSTDICQALRKVSSLAVVYPLPSNIGFLTAGDHQ